MAASASEKYDRQLRLWGEEGQARLEAAHVCLINGTATGAETLKNLVLPGIGAFTVVDGNKVEAADLGNNFFLDEDSLGKPRAQRVTELLNELNDRVKGYSVEEDAITLINERISFFETFDVVVATSLPEAPLRKLAAFLYQRGKALFVVRAYGFLGSLRVAVPEHTIIESKPDNPTDDLRIYRPFAELERYVQALDLSSLDSTAHGHVPFVILLVKALATWRAQHEGKAPETRAEKDEFRRLISAMSRDIHKEENFEQALKNALKAWMPPSIPEDVREIIGDEKARGALARETEDFWVLATALREFVENEGHGDLPLTGTIPDMVSDTNSYISLQRVYHERAQADIAAVAARVDALVSRLGRPAIGADLVKKFCKNARFLKVLRYRSLEDELAPETARKDYLGGQLSQPDSNAQWYLLLRGVDRFFAAQGKYPGAFDGDVEPDISVLKSFVAGLLNELGLPPASVRDEAIHEVCRFGAAEMHNMAALMGGVTSQEIIKIVTHQYVPLNNTFIFNGMSSTSVSLQM